MDKKMLDKIKKELPSTVTLLAVSKTHSKAEIDEAYACGCTIFGENKVQELKEKYSPNYHWHMIGHLQRNKVKDVVPLVDMIESVDSLRLVEEIEKQCAKIDKVMPILIEVNISRESNKTGVLLEECPLFVKQCLNYPHVVVKGLMCVGPLDQDIYKTEECFEKMNILFQKLQSEYGKESMTYLSMGMSGDYQIALRYNANIIRLGTIIFGKRS